MNISYILKNWNSNRVESIKKMKKGEEKDLAIGSLIADLGKRTISAVSKI